MSKVTKRNRSDEYDQDFWLVNGEVWTEYEDEERWGELVNGPADECDAHSCGTTLSALHQELTEGGEDGR